MIVFDTLELVKELEVAGFPPSQAEAQTRILVKLLQRVDDARQDQLATRQEVVSLDAKMELRTAELKRDIKELDAKIETTKAELKRDLKELDTKIETTKAELKRDLKEMDTRLETRFKELDTRLETRFKESDTRLETRFKELDSKLETAKDLIRKDIAVAVSASKVEIIRWVVGMGVVIIGGMTTIDRIFPKPVTIQQIPGQEMRWSPVLPPPGR